MIILTTKRKEVLVISEVVTEEWGNCTPRNVGLQSKTQEPETSQRSIKRV